MNTILIRFSVLLLLVAASCTSGNDGETEQDVNFEVTSPLKKDTTILKDYVVKFNPLAISNCVR